MLDFREERKDPIRSASSKNFSGKDNKVETSSLAKSHLAKPLTRQELGRIEKFSHNKLKAKKPSQNLASVIEQESESKE